MIGKGVVYEIDVVCNNYALYDSFRNSRHGYG